MSEGKSLIPISTLELARVCRRCLLNIADYNGEDDKVYEHTYWSWREFKSKTKQTRQRPRWMYSNAGIIKRLNELYRIAERVDNDNSVETKVVLLTETSYTNLYYCLHKDKRFEPFIFGLGY